jgi:2',3'-cyclic-nucleotide 2'-phosphodiesterase (5'-nucleotidase family)
VMIERGGVRTAVIGIALSTTPDIVLAGRTAGLEFTAEAPAIDQAAREARAAGADFVVVSAHIGAVCERPGTAPEEPSAACVGEALSVADAVTEPVDLIVAGHTHRRVLTTQDSIPVVEAASYSTAYSLTDLERRGGRTVAIRREVRTPFADEVSPDTAVARVVEEWERNVRPVTERVVVTAAEAMPREGGEHALGNLVADAMRAQAGAQASIVNNGSVRRDLPAGPLSWGVLFELHPFANALVRTEVTGAQLRAALENAVNDGRTGAHISGMTVRWAPSAPTGSRIREIRLDDGRVVDDDDVITLGLSEFLATGGDRYTSLAAGRTTRLALVDLDALIAYLESLPQPIRGPATGRWVEVQ